MEETKNPTKSIVTISKVAHILCFIAFVFCCIGAAFGLIGMIASPFIDWAWLRQSISDGATKSGTPLSWDVNVLNITNAEVFSTNMLLSSGCGAWLCFVCHAFFNNIVLAKTPFNSPSVHSLSMIGIASLISAIGVPLIMSIIEAATKTTNLFSATWNGISVFFALFVFFLSLIFKYGVILQKEADTTL